MSNQPTLTCSAESADSPLLLNVPASKLSPSVKLTATAKRSSGRGSGRLWPTPVATEGGAGVDPTQRGRKLHLEVHGFTETSEPSTQPDTAAAPYSQGDFLASHSVSPGSEKARQMTASSGRKCSVLLTRQDPLGCLVRMLLESSRWNSTECYLTWKVSATPAGRLLYRLVPSMPNTDETGCGLWRTPGAGDGDRGAQDGEERLSQGHTMSLASHVKTPNLWPTAASRDYKGGRSAEALAASGRSERNNLNDAVNSANGAVGSLNPTWVEWLMGYPSGWTDLRDSETPSSRKSRTKSLKESGVCCERQPEAP
jgi:hypothetical protein